MKPISAYLTAFLKHTPGLLLILALVGCSGSRSLNQTGTPHNLTAEAESTAIATPRPIRTPTVSATDTPTPTTAPISTLGVQADKLNGLTITFWHPWSGEQGEQMENLLSEFNRTNSWGISVQATSYNGLGWLEEAMQAALNGGTPPDLVVGYNYQAQHWDASSRALVDLNEYASDPVWGLSAEEQADFYPVFWEEGIAGSTNGPGKQLGLPLHRSALVLYYNRSFSLRLGFSGLPDTPYELRVRACAAAEANATDGQSDNDGSGGWLITPEPSLLVGWVYAFGGEITRADGRGYQFNTPEAGQALDYLKGLQDSGCAYQAPGADPAAEFAARRALFYAGSLSELPVVEAAFAAAGNGDNWTVLPFPAEEADAVLLTYGPALMITRSESPRQLAAWLAARWLVEPSNQAQWAAANNLLPVRQSTLELLSEPLAEDPHWAAAVELLPLARSEPAYVSWSVMRWALNDAMAELFDPDFSSGQIPDLLEALEQVALEIFTQVR